MLHQGYIYRDLYRILDSLVNVFEEFSTQTIAVQVHMKKKF